MLTDLEVSRDGDALVVRTFPKGGFPTLASPAEPAPPPIRMAFADTERLVGLDPPFQQTTARVLRQGGEIAWLRYPDSGRIHRRIA